MFESKAKINMWVECGDDYYFGRCDETIDYEMAAIFYGKAMNKKHPRATYMLGLCYELGNGVECDMEYAELLYERAAEYGDTDAKVRIASGEAVMPSAPAQDEIPQSDSDALELAKMRYEQGDFARVRELCEGQAADLPYAQFMLGVMYQNGEGVKADSKAAFRCYEKAARQGLADAQYNLGILYYNGDGVKQNRVKTLYWYEEAAQQGDVFAQHDAANMYYNGIGTEVDFRKAFIWFQKSAVRGDSEAQFSLAKLYENGEGTEQDNQKAVEWMIKAAEQGHTEAQLSLHEYYSHGRIAEQDADRAAFWRNKGNVSHSTLRSITGCTEITPDILKVKIKECTVSFDALALSFLLIKISRGVDCLYDKDVVRAYLSDFFPVSSVLREFAVHLYDSGAVGFLSNESENYAEAVKKLTDTGVGLYEAEMLIRCFTDAKKYDKNTIKQKNMNRSKEEKK